MKDRLEGLSLAARRGELPANEELELERLLEGAPDERIWHRAGLRFDEQDAPAAGDDELAGRLLQRVLAEQPRALPRPRRTRPVMLLVAAAVSVATAAAAVVGYTQLRQAGTPKTEAPPASETSSATNAPRLPSPAAVQAPVAPTPSAMPQPAAPAEVEERSPLVKSEELPATATELLSSAGQARRKGQAARAITLLESLQSRFPGSAEARASDITLGMLRLERGAAGTALKDFDRYLGRSPNGERAADALWGRSKALLALGRRDDAELGLRQLLSRYPQSPFASAARAELSR